MATKINRTKQLLDALKTKGVKASKSGKKSIVVDGSTVAHVYEGANDSIRVYVFAEKLPAKLAKKFTLTKSSGYAQRFASDDDLSPLVDAIVFVAQSDEQPAAEPAAKSESASSSKQATTASKRASARSESV